MIDLHAIAELREWMIANNVAHARVGDVELTLTEHAFLPLHVEPSEESAEVDPIDTGPSSPYMDPDLWNGTVPRLRNRQAGREMTG